MLFQNAEKWESGEETVREHVTVTMVLDVTFPVANVQMMSVHLDGKDLHVIKVQYKDAFLSLLKMTY